MAAILLDGRPIASALRSELKQRVGRITAAGASPPALGIVLIGDDPASELYATRLEKAGTAISLTVALDRYPADTNNETLAEIVRDRNADRAVDAVIVAMPLPEGLSSDVVSSLLDPRKDVDGITVANAGNLYLGRPGHIPSTAAAIMEILHAHDIAIKGKRAVVLGRSPVVGKPVSMLLLREHATVTICHTRTVNLPDVTLSADILIAAAGSAGCIDGSMIKPGATVIDAGINAVDGGMVGDVDFESAVPVAGAITPVPGGVGPLTNILLLRAVIAAAESRD